MSKRSRKILALWLVLAVVGEGLLALGHAAEIHVRCPEHGELVHLEIAASADAGASATLDSRIDRGASADGEQGHEHCVANASARERSAPTRTTVPCLDCATRAVAPPTAVIAPARLAVHRIAPKTSPPA